MFSSYIGSRGRLHGLAGKHISLQAPFKEGDQTEWFKRYEICCTANEWSEATQLVKLPTLLEGEALAVWLELAPEDQRDYKTAKRTITARMSPLRFVSLEDCHARRATFGFCAPAESDSPRAATLAPVCGWVGLQLQAVGEIDNLDKVIERAKLLLTIDKGENIAAIKTTEMPREMEVLQQQVSLLSEQVAALTT